MSRQNRGMDIGQVSPKLKSTTLNSVTLFQGMLVVLIFCMGIVLIAPTSLNPDAAWLLYASQQMMDGDKLYVDIVEVNPPLIVWLGTLPVLLAKLSGLTIGFSFKAIIFAMAAMSLIFSAKILKIQNSNYIGPIIVAATYALTIFPSFSFGQREHILVILCLPYLFVASAAAKRIQLPLWRIIVASILAGIGFCIKPYFVLIPAAVELFMLARLKKETFRRPEPYIMVLVGVSYVLAIFIFTPEYNSKIIGYATEVYSAGHGYPTERVLHASTPIIFFSVYGLMLLFYERVKIADVHAEYAVLACAALGSVAVFFAQFKGWVYHLVPANIFVLILFIGAIYYLLFKSDFKILNVIKSIPLVVFVFVMAVFLVLMPMKNGTFARVSEELKPAIAEYSDVDTIFIMTDNLDNGFPLINETGLTWGSRYPALWLTPGIQAKRAAGENYALLDEIEQFSHRSVAADIARYKPQLIFVDIGEFRSFWGLKYDYIADYSRSDQFAAEWSNYSFVRDVGNRAMYRRIIENK